MSTILVRISHGISIAEFGLNPGTSDPEFVKQVQQALKAKGVYSGKIDGKMGPSTMDAIRAFQKANKLEATADKSLDDETLRALGISR